MGGKTSAIYTFVLQLIAIFLLVFLFLVVMLVIVGNSPIMILFTPSGILLEIIFVIYFWLIIFPLSGKPKKPKKSDKKEGKK
ncbi:MAG: hypothetical protein QCH99_02760 [Candidatus Bathyarchaeota archaeon]|nr:hypothetical protein [Candidatus Bathyarchaeum tardum]WGM89036.1 MAG: hypothetical protein NUK63_08985 [Candidatus Bathyarchaeum tardum]